ncbi:MAG: threonine synthase [Thermomicrobiales bacterium]|nr:threonine synthase [Thermomicrobiales bacterium]
MICGASADGSPSVSQCAACGGLLDVAFAFDQPLARGDFSALPLATQVNSGVWRYRQLLPWFPTDQIVTRAEGFTPIYWDDRLAHFGGVGRLGLKHEGQNPTGSFKDRGMTVGVTHAKSVGATMVACASTGNTSASLASYAAAAGMSALVLIPEGKIAGGKLAQTIAHGAHIVQVEGDFDIALRMLRELTAGYPVYLVNSVNPYRVEGQKTIVIEMFEQLDWQVPDVIALPGGNLGNTAAFGKALIDLQMAGLIDRIPRLLTIQAEGASPFVDYFESGFDRYEPVTAETVATAIKIGNPASVERARRAIQFSSGMVARVTDAEIMEAKAMIDRCGIGCEPASAATLAGIRKQVALRQIGPDAHVVGVLTGHLLKDTEAVVRFHLEDAPGERSPLVNRPVSIPADMDALKRTLSNALQG